jgi:hypothetical protein
MGMGESSDYEAYFKGLELDLNPRKAHLVYTPDFYERVPPGSHIVAPSEDKLDPWNHAVYMGGRRIIHGDSTGMKEDCVNDFVENSNAVCIIEYDEDGQWPRAATIRAVRFLKNMKQHPEKRFANVPVLCRVGLERYDLACKKVDVLLRQNEVRIPPQEDRIHLAPVDRTKRFACSIHAAQLSTVPDHLKMQLKTLPVSSKSPKTLAPAVVR